MKASLKPAKAFILPFDAGLGRPSSGDFVSDARATGWEGTIGGEVCQGEEEAVGGEKAEVEAAEGAKASPKPEAGEDVLPAPVSHASLDVATPVRASRTPSPGRPLRIGAIWGPLDVGGRAGDIREPGWMTESRTLLGAEEAEELLAGATRCAPVSTADVLEAAQLDTHRQVLWLNAAHLTDSLVHLLDRRSPCRVFLQHRSCALG